MNYCDCGAMIIWISTNGVGGREGYYACLRCDSEMLIRKIEEIVPLVTK